MKVAIPVDERHLDSSVCLSFGRAPYFLFYDTTTKETYYLDNSAIENPSGAGIKAAQIIVDHGAKALLTPRCGENAQEVLRKSEVLVYQSIPGTAQENIDAFEAGKLTLLSDFHSGAGRHGR
ncbi:MAG: NifB/NifX family molybdenum-iron cluster-binding protein [Bacillota bacterium]